MSFYKFIYILFLTLNIFGCVEKTSFSGKILTLDNLDIRINNKNELLKNFGEPSYIDKQLNKYFYFAQKDKDKNFYNKKSLYSYVFVFEFNNQDEVISRKAINLLDIKSHEYKNAITENNILERGLIEKIFGGVGANKIIENSP